MIAEPRGKLLAMLLGNMKCEDGGISDDSESGEKSLIVTLKVPKAAYGVVKGWAS